MSHGKMSILSLGIAFVGITLMIWVEYEDSMAKWRAATKDDVATIVDELRLNGSASKNGACFMAWVINNRYYMIEIETTHATISAYYPYPKYELTAQEIWRMWLDGPKNILPWIRKETFRDDDLDGVAENSTLLIPKTHGNAFYEREIPLGAKADIIVQKTYQRAWNVGETDAMQARYRAALHAIAEHIRTARHH